MVTSARERAGIALRPVGPRAILPCSRHLDNAPEDLPGDMSFWRRLFGSNPSESLRPQRLDYLNEALALERQGDYEAALTSYRLALRDHPTDPKILQNMAIAYTKTGLTEEAIRHYRRALELDPNLVGAHYGMAFLLLKKGDPEQAASHLRAFLARPPRGTDAERWIKHAEAHPAAAGGRQRRGRSVSSATRLVTLAFSAAWLAGCSSPNANPDEVIALQVTAPTINRRFIEQNDTLNIQTKTLWGVALNLAGDSIASVIIWRCADTTAAVPDSFIPYIYGIATSGNARIQANTAGLFSPVLNYTVRPRTDTIIFAGPDTIRVLSGNDTSARLNVEVDSYNPAGPLATRTVIYTITSPVFATVAARTVEFTNGWLVRHRGDQRPPGSRSPRRSGPAGHWRDQSRQRHRGRYRPPVRAGGPCPGPGSGFIVRFDP